MDRTSGEGKKLAAAFGHAVRRRRAKLGLSQEELAFQAELDRTYISGVERGVRNPTMKSLWRIASALKSKPSRIFAAAEEDLVGGPT